MKRVFTIIIFGVLLFTAVSAAENSTSSQSSPISHFVWGADIGSSIDIIGNDMSSMDIDAYFGFKNNIIRTVGIGVGIHSSLGNSHSFIPIYAILRTNFTSHPTICFADLRIGYSFNSLNSIYTQNGLYGSGGIGFNLYTSPKFKSHLILSYGFNQLKGYTVGEYFFQEVKNLSAMSVRIGISF